MVHQPRALALLAHVTRGLLRHGDQHTARQLGDRSTYVGLSDVGRAITCLRAAVASKLGNAGSVNGDDIVHWLHDKKEQPITDALGRQLVLQRGHWLEAGVENALRANGANLIHQLEIIIADGAVPIRAHLDFVLVSGGNQTAIRVLELKSTEHLPQPLYPAYEIQLYGQIGLLKTYWDQPVFSLKDEQGVLTLDRQTFPQVCHHLFGIAMPNSAAKTEIEGWVLCLSMSEARAFGPYCPDAGMLAMCRRVAEKLWSTAKAVQLQQIKLDDVEICSGFHPLCDWCDHADGCPKFKADPVNDPILDDDLADLAKLKADKADIEAQIEERETRIRQFYNRVGNDTAWLSTANYRFKTTRIGGRKSVDTNKLRAELTNCVGEVDTDALLTRATTVGDGYERLTVSPIKASIHKECLP